MPTEKPIVYILLYRGSSQHYFSGGTLGVYSSEEAAKTEAQRYAKKTELQWQKMIDTGDQRIHAQWLADLPWELPTKIEITAYRLDSKAFRP